MLDVFYEAPAILKELTLTEVSYAKQRNLDDFVLQMDLECLSLRVTDLQANNFDGFVDQCCQSHNKHHVLCLPMKYVELPDVMGEPVERLLREDKKLLFLHFTPRFFSFNKTGLPCGVNVAPASTVQHLSIRSEVLHVEQVRLLSETLSMNCNLLSLSFELERCNAQKLVFLGIGIARNTVLLSFKADCPYGCDVSAEYVEMFANDLAENQTLKSLKLHGLVEGIQRSSFFAKFLKRNRSLQVFSLANEIIGKTGARRIIEAAKQHETLEVLCIDNCGETSFETELANKAQLKKYGQNDKANRGLLQLVDTRESDDVTRIFRKHQWWQSGVRDWNTLVDFYCD